MRKEWMGALARAPVEELEKAWEGLSRKPSYNFLRQPETGLVMVRGRLEGAGARFNLGEATLTRCTVKLDGGAAGFGYVMGGNRRHAELAAVFDALLQDPDEAPGLVESVIRPIEDSLRKREERTLRETESTRVEFFTMVRGE